MNTALEHRIQVAHEALASHEQSHLNPYYRYLIYGALDPDPDSNPESPEPDWGETLVRTLLGIVTTRHIFPVWLQNWPEDDLVERLLSTTEQELRSPVRLPESGVLLGEGWDQLEGMGHGTHADFKQRGLFAGMAAHTTLVLAVRNTDPFTTSYEGHGERIKHYLETDLDPWTSDVAHWAAMASAGGLWMESFDRAKSLEFWTWWLDEAVPEAWRWRQEF